MEEHLKKLRLLAKKGQLTAYELRDAMVSLYLVISRLNQTDGNPDVGLHQEPRGLLGHIHGFMAAVFWEHGFDFEHPTVQQLAEIKMMMDGMVQLYAMPEPFQQVLNDTYALLLAKALGRVATVTAGMMSMLGLDAESASTPASTEIQSEEAAAADASPALDESFLEDIPAPDTRVNIPAAEVDADNLEAETEMPAAAMSTDSAFEPQATQPEDQELVTESEKLYPAAVETSQIDQADSLPPVPEELPAEPLPSASLPKEPSADERLFWNFEPAKNPPKPLSPDKDLALELPPLTADLTALQPEINQEPSQPEAARKRTAEIESKSAEPLPAPESSQPVKKKRGRKKLSETTNEARPKRRRRGRQQGLKIDLGSVQVPEEFLEDTDEEAALETEPVQEPKSESDFLPSEQELESGQPQVGLEEKISQTPATPLEPALTQEPALTWQPEKAEKILFTKDEDRIEDWEPQLETKASEPQPQPSSNWANELESIPEVKSSPSDWKEIHPQPAVAASKATPVSPDTRAFRLTPAPELTESAAAAKKGIVSPASEKAPSPTPGWNRKTISQLLLACLIGFVLGAGISYYWFGIHLAQIRQTEKTGLQHQLEQAQAQLNETQLKAENWKKELDQYQTLALQKLDKPKYIPVGQGVLLYWIDKDIARKYYIYRAKGQKGKFEKINSQPTRQNILLLPKVSPGTWKYAITAITPSGPETEKSEVLTLKFPLRR